MIFNSCFAFVKSFKTLYKLNSEFSIKVIFAGSNLKISFDNSLPIDPPAPVINIEALLNLDFNLLEENFMFFF